MEARTVVIGPPTADVTVAPGTAPWDGETTGLDTDFCPLLELLVTDAGSATLLRA